MTFAVFLKTGSSADIRVMCLFQQTQKKNSIKAQV